MVSTSKQEKERKTIKKGLDLRKEVNFQTDFYGLGHFLLFLLYSNFSFGNHEKEKSSPQRDGGGWVGRAG